MQILAITQDKSLSQIFSEDSISSTAEFKIFDRTTDPLEVISMVHSISPNMLILDDDMLKPNSFRILKSIKQIRENEVIVFLTSDNGLDLGREISPLGVFYYGIKPITKEEISDLIKSVSTKNKSINYS